MECRQINQNPKPQTKKKVEKKKSGEKKKCSNEKQKLNYTANIADTISIRTEPLQTGWCQLWPQMTILGRIVFVYKYKESSNYHS